MPIERSTQEKISTDLAKSRMAFYTIAPVSAKAQNLVLWKFIDLSCKTNNILGRPGYLLLGL